MLSAILYVWGHLRRRKRQSFEVRLVVGVGAGAGRRSGKAFEVGFPTVMVACAGKAQVYEAGFPLAVVAEAGAGRGTRQLVRSWIPARNRRRIH